MAKIAAYKKMLNDAIVDFANGKKTKIRSIWQSGAGKHAKYSSDHTSQYISYLNLCRCNCLILNDAPRGGKLGKYIVITKVY